MKRLLMAVALVAALGYAAWRYWQASNAENARAWAAGTDKIG